jgi:transketolase N-terminal domain/subunit
MTAAHYKLDNLTAIIDNNRLQIDGFVSEGMNSKPTNGWPLAGMPWKLMATTWAPSFGP